MDLDYIPQDVARCDHCKTAIVQSYCDFCHVNLCKSCIGEHISDEYDKHKIVPFQKRRSTLIYPKCEKHLNKTCKYQCKDCSIFLCTNCFASKQHNKDHELLQLSEVFNKKKELIQKDKEEINKQLLPAYEDMATELEKQIANLDTDYKKLSTEISKHREDMHREIDYAMNQMETEISQNKMKHLAILKRHLDEIKQSQSIMQKTLNTLNEIGDSNEVFSTIHYSSKVHEFKKLPPKVHVSIPKFIQKQIKNREELYNLLGKLTPLSTILEERLLMTKTPNTLIGELLDCPLFLNTIKTEYGKLHNVTCLNEDQIWTSGRKTAEIKCFNTQGVLQKTIKTKSGEVPNDIAVYSDGVLVYSDWSTRKVYRLKNDQTEEIIGLQGWTPSQLCVDSFGDLLVTMYSDDCSLSKVVRFCFGSTVNQTIQFDDDGRHLYSGNAYTKYISDNRNLDICVADYGAGAVVVVNQTGRLRFRYTGHPSPTKNKPFAPRGITTDSQGRILTSDGDNHCIHILDTDGLFLRYINNYDLKYPYGLCVDNDDSLFVCEFYTGNVRKIIYSK